MLKIKNIEFIKTVYDESLSHNIFSIANIQFSNYPPINGALLYWKKTRHALNLLQKAIISFFMIWRILRTMRLLNFQKI